MAASRVIALMAVAFMIGGCAGPQTREEMARLQSQIGLLNERMSQLERSATSGGFTEAAFPEPAAAVETYTAPAPSQPTPARTGTLKPTTREIQQALKNAGFYQGSVDGKTGPLTREAVKEFQRVHGLVDDGKVGKLTWGKLQAYADLSAQPGELSAAEILK